MVDYRRLWKMLIDKNMKKKQQKKYETNKFIFNLAFSLVEFVKITSIICISPFIMIKILKDKKENK